MLTGKERLWNNDDRMEPISRSNGTAEGSTNVNVDPGAQRISTRPRYEEKVTTPGQEAGWFDEFEPNVSATSEHPSVSYHDSGVRLQRQAKSG
jgi:hypothetical protein